MRGGRLGRRTVERRRPEHRGELGQARHRLQADRLGGVLLRMVSRLAPDRL